MNRHKLEEPTTAETRSFLRRTCGEDADDVWRRACVAAGVTDTPELGPVKLLAVAKELVAMGGRPSIIGNCTWIRLDAYDQLEGPS